MRTASDLIPLLAALKQMHGELQNLRYEIDKLRDDVKVMDRGVGNVHFTFGEHESDEDESSDSDSSECASVQSAPATVSYEREV